MLLLFIIVAIRAILVSTEIERSQEGEIFSEEKRGAREDEAEAEDADGVDDVGEEGGAGVGAVAEDPGGVVQPGGEGGEGAAEAHREGRVERLQAGGGGEAGAGGR